MAPPSGPRGGSSTATSRGRGNARGGGRGGISKRRAPGVRVDKDGDMNMDASGDRAGRSNTRHASRAAHNVARQLGIDTSKHPLSTRSSTRRGGMASRSKFAKGSTIKIQGLKNSKASNNPDGGLKSLLEFLERKASKGSTTVAIGKGTISGDSVFISVDKDYATEILRLNDFEFAGAKLTITETNEPWPKAAPKQAASAQTEQLKSKLLQVLASRYTGESKLLNLSSLGADQALVELGLFEDKSRAEKAFKALLTVADQSFKTPQEKQDAIQSISLSNNGLTHVSQVFEVADEYPKLQNLDLSHNQFDRVSKLSRWRHRFRFLQVLITTGNPFETLEPNWKTELVEWFPRLQTLNDEIVRTPEQIAAREAAEHPHPIPQAGPDFRDTNGIGEQFIRQFYAAFDNNRPELLNTFYDPESEFSLAVVTTSPVHGDAPVPPWAPWLQFSRNLTKITAEHGRIRRLFWGVESVRGLWSSFPATQHPDLSETQKWIIDCHPVSGLADPNGQEAGGVDGLLIMVHGEFEEIDPATKTQGKRSFSRTFVLGPAYPGSQNAIRVVSDQLSLRAWNPVPTFGPPTLAANDPEQERRRQMVLELSNRTNMTLDYAELCLAGVDWDFDRALLVFEEKKSVLPPEAYKQLPAV